jgi:hypothetical protein
LAAGTYTVTVTDANACVVTLPVIISEPTAVSITSATVTSNYNGAQISCAGRNDATASVTATGGTGVLRYLWSASAGNQTTAAVTGLAAGVHRVTVTDANGCATSSAITVTAPAAIAATVTVNGAGCFGGNNGQVDAVASGGTAPYTFSLNGGTPQASGTFAGLTAGTYTVVISDANGCTTTRTVSISQAGILTATAAVTSNYNGQQISCVGATDGRATATAAGGASPYSFAWSTGATGANVTGLPAGVHIVTVTDANNCNATASVTVTPPAAITATVSNIVNAGCFGGNNGSFRVQATGGAGTYTYSSSLGSNGTGFYNNVSAGAMSLP